MFPGNGTTQLISCLAGLIFKGGDFLLFIPFIGEALAQDIEMDIAVAGVADTAEDDAQRLSQIP